LLRALKQMIERKHRRVPLPAGIDLDRVRRARDFFAFDDAYTAPLHGFADARDYYHRSACGPFLQDIATPTLIINALDDPFMQRSIIPRAAELAPAVTLELSKRGGHVGFIGADDRGRPAFWLEQRLADWLDVAVPAPLKPTTRG